MATVRRSTGSTNEWSNGAFLKDVGKKLMNMYSDGHQIFKN